MAQKNLNARISWRRDTSANWTSANPVLLNGEIIVVDTAEGEVRFKIGDGIKTYTQLPFEDEVIRNLINAKSAVTLETWNNATAADNSVAIGNLIINKVKDQATYDAMEAAGKIDDNELYLIEGEGLTIVPEYSSINNGLKIASIYLDENISQEIWVPVVSESINGLMSSLDKQNLNKILNIDYDQLLGFDTSEIVVGNISTTSVLGQAILGQMILA